MANGKDAEFQARVRKCFWTLPATRCILYVSLLGDIFSPLLSVFIIIFFFFTVARDAIFVPHWCEIRGNRGRSSVTATFFTASNYPLSFPLKMKKKYIYIFPMTCLNVVEQINLLEIFFYKYAASFFFSFKTNHCAYDKLNDV